MTRVHARNTHTHAQAPLTASHQLLVLARGPAPVEQVRAGVVAVLDEGLHEVLLAVVLLADGEEPVGQGVYGQAGLAVVLDLESEKRMGNHRKCEIRITNKEV